jgi:aryl-alcohol dehydrogenase-like predicted oxidoreductase
VEPVCADAEEGMMPQAELVLAGMVRHVGLSNVTVEQLRAALTVHPIAAVQVEWSLWRPIDPELLDLCRSEAIGIVAWSPLGQGLLAAPTLADEAPATDDFRQYLPRWSEANRQQNADRYEPVLRIAEAVGATPAQLALAWLLHEYDDVVAIPAVGLPHTSPRTPQRLS